MEMNKCIHFYKIKKDNINKRCNDKIGKGINGFLLLCKRHYSKDINKKHCNNVKQLLKVYNINMIDYFYQKINYYEFNHSYEIKTFLKILVNFCLSENEINEIIDILNFLIEKQIYYIKLFLFKNVLLPYEINTLILFHLKKIYLEDYINMIK